MGLSNEEFSYFKEKYQHIDVTMELNTIGVMFVDGVEFVRFTDAAKYLNALQHGYNIGLNRGSKHVER